VSDSPQPRSRSLRRPLLIGAVAVGLVGASAGAAFSQEVPVAQVRAATPAAAPAGDAAAGQATGRGPAVPPELVPPGEHVLSAVLPAHGVQVYGCVAGAWKFTEPVATLAGSTVRPARRVSAIHYRGPSWQSVEDGSVVVAAPTASSPVPGSIPQLLLKAGSTRGPGVFGQITYVQRLATSGGTAPATACTEGANLSVPYRALYRFFVAA
jgi:hypothetical protein